MKGRVCLVIALFCWLTSAGQTSLPDTLLEKFKGVRRDTAFIDNLNVLAFDNLRSNPVLGRQISAYTQTEAQALKYTRGYARALSIMGSSYWYEGVYEIAQNYYLAAARQYQSIQDSLGLGKMYNNIGEVYKKLEQYNKSLEYQLLSLKMHRSDPAAQRLTLYNVGEIYLGLRQYDKSLDYLNRALDMAKLADDKRVVAYCYWSYGNIRAAQKKYMDAIGFYQLSENLWAELGEKRALTQTYQDFALAYKALGNYKKAEEYLQRSGALTKEVNALDLEARNYLYKFQLDSARGRFDQALQYLYRYNLLSDSLYTSNKAEQINRLQTIYDTENRERENAALRAETTLHNAEIRSQRLIIFITAAGLLFSTMLLGLVFVQRQRILKVNKQLHDKSEEIQAQAESLMKLNTQLSSLNKNLESLVEERTAQIRMQNRQLAEYTFMNAHKLRAPVASILGLINLLPSASADERAHIFDHLKNCSEDLDFIIREMGRNLEGAIVDKE